MEQDLEPKACPICEYKNAPSAIVCVRCGTPLKPSTFPVSAPKPETSETPTSAPQPESPAVEGIALWVRSNPRPLIIRAETGAILGRKVGAVDEPKTLVDLTAYNAYKLGVSRRHAQLESSQRGFTLIDLGSSNGTWVNGLRMQPYQPGLIKKGDRVHLARLEMIVGPITEEALRRAQADEDSKSAAQPPITNAINLGDKSGSARPNAEKPLIEKPDLAKLNSGKSAPEEPGTGSPGAEARPTEESGSAKPDAKPGDRAQDNNSGTNNANGDRKPGGNTGSSDKP